tara:strand:- start:847 stop:1140 length:294 start_codon:yes stop_codon:yes gene_type:complete
MKTEQNLIARVEQLTRLNMALEQERTKDKTKSETKTRALGECTAEIVRLQSPPADLADYLNRFPDREMLRRWLNLKPDLSPNFEWTWDWDFDAGKEG